jgi:hypothetical protein
MIRLKYPQALHPVKALSPLRFSLFQVRMTGTNLFTTRIRT